jgi:hypothetical protein
MELKELSTKIQIKLYQFSRRYSAGFSRPDQKFIWQMLFGILKGGKVQLNSIARSLQEGLSLKKTAERLGRHLGAVGFWLELSAATLESQRHYLRQCKYMIIDLSDIQKEYAQKMAGLALVYDGSKNQLGAGYWLCNVTGVDELGKLIVPAYSELYSFKEESTSQNAKVLNAIEQVCASVGEDKIWVLDRGGDRKRLMLPLLRAQRRFIIRQDGDRYLNYQGENLPFKEVSRQVKLSQTFRVTKLRKNKQIKETYDCGAVKVRLPGSKQELWLVVLKERNKGYCWLLCHLPGLTKKQAIKTAFTGYGHRWKTEEVHRHFKSDYQWEGICLQRYEALKSMNALLWAALSFLYTRLETLSAEIIVHPELALVNRKSLYDLFRFVFYKLALAVKKLLALSKFYNLTIFSSTIDKQLSLALG